jgi:hypothetical protein
MYMVRMFCCARVCEELSAVLPDKNLDYKRVMLRTEFQSRGLAVCHDGQRM